MCPFVVRKAISGRTCCKTFSNSRIPVYCRVWNTCPMEPRMNCPIFIDSHTDRTLLLSFYPMIDWSAINRASPLAFTVLNWNTYTVEGLGHSVVASSLPILTPAELDHPTINKSLKLTHISHFLLAQRALAYQTFFSNLWLSNFIVNSCLIGS